MSHCRCSQHLCAGEHLTFVRAFVFRLSDMVRIFMDVGRIWGQSAATVVIPLSMGNQLKSTKLCLCVRVNQPSCRQYLDTPCQNRGSIGVPITGKSIRFIIAGIRRLRQRALLTDRFLQHQYKKNRQVTSTSSKYVNQLNSTMLKDK